MKTDTKLATLLGRKTLIIHFEDGSSQEITVQQVRVRDYESAWKFYNDDLGLAAFLCGQPREFVTGSDTKPGVMPESLEAILTSGREINENGFFSFCRRRLEREAATAREQAIIGVEMLRQMPAELREQTLAAANRSTSSISSPSLRQRPG